MKDGCSVHLYSGIGNVIQGIPFIFELKRHYKRVTGYVARLDYIKETSQILEGVLDEIYEDKNKVPANYIKYSHPKHGPFSEYDSWFLQHGYRIPEDIGIPFINYEKTDKKHKVVIWTEGKKNWPCKKWPYWSELSEKLEDVAVIGIEKDFEFKNVTDYRGKLSLLELGGLIKNADYYIGNEGGISHYSAALGTKTFIIYGGTHPEKNMPPGNAIRLSKNLHCQPCQFNGMKREGIIMIGCNDRPCLNDFSPDEVLEKMKI